MLRQLDLCLCLGRLGAHGEYVEYERRAVEYLHLQLFLDIAYLLGRKLIVEDDHSHLTVGLGLVFYILAYLGELAASHIGDGARAVHFLRKPLHGDGSRRVGEELQLVEILLGLGLVLLVGDKAHEHSSLCLGLGYYKFLHSLLSFKRLQIYAFMAKRPKVCRWMMYLVGAACPRPVGNGCAGQG